MPAHTLVLKDCNAFLADKGFLPRVGIAVRNGKIIRIGKDIRHPKGAQIVDAKGACVTPGLIDGHTHLGMSEVGDADYNEATDPVTPYLRVADAINPLNPDFRLSLANGITTVMVCPGSANVFGGLLVIMKTRGRRLRNMLLQDPAGMKMALGQNPKRGYGGKGKLPASRMGSAYLARNTFAKAKEYRKKRAKRGDKKASRDLGMEHILGLLDGKYPARWHCHRADDIMTAVQIAEEFGFDVCIDHATESYLVASELADRDVPCFVGPSFGIPGKNEVVYKGFTTARKLREAGVRFAIITDHGVEPCWFLPVAAGLAARQGLAADDALRAITSWPAEIMGIDKRVGKLAPGCDADIVIWDRSPLQLGKPEAVYVNGAIVTEKELNTPFPVREI
ncbi:MAG: amidohydrolase [Planctomycetes bacterium]|nr:amidohydrolase [Planctomycetota bacterium]